MTKKDRQGGEEMMAVTAHYPTQEHAIADETESTAELERARLTSLRILAEVFGPLGSSCPVRFRLWDGTTWTPPDARSVSSTVVLNHPGALRRALLPPGDLAAGEAFVRGDFDIEGDVEAVCAAGFAAGDALPRTPSALGRLGILLASLPRSAGAGAAATRPHAATGLEGRGHSRERDLRAVRHHYDVGNDFYALWLDRAMVYSCAYFERGDEDLDTAQEAKLDHICAKLRLSPGERLLDIGCGWGGLVMHAAERFGAAAVGITLSEEQARLARQKAAWRGLSDSVDIEVLDYRDAGRLGSFDKAVSVGMVEHVGLRNLDEYFATAFGVLRPGGLFLNHGITGARPGRVSRRSFIQRYVFPDGELETIGQTLRSAESSGFEVRDVESLREHYMTTLRHWVRRLEEHEQEAVRASSEETYRIWRLYMAGSAHSFKTGAINVYQTLLSKPTGDVSELPLTRSHLYA